MEPSGAGKALSVAELKDEVVVGDVGGVEDWSTGVVIVVWTFEGVTVPIKVGEGVPAELLLSEST